MSNHEIYKNIVPRKFGAICGSPRDNVGILYSVIVFGVALWEHTHIVQEMLTSWILCPPNPPSYSEDGKTDITLNIVT